MVQPRRLLIVTGQEGAGKSTIVRALLPHTPLGAQIDGEEVAQVNPWVFNDMFRHMHRRNVSALVLNFWRAGYTNVIAGSFVRNVEDYAAFRLLLPRIVEVYVVQLLAGKEVRDARRAARGKPTSREWREGLDLSDPEDTTLRDGIGDYRYVGIDTSELSVSETVELIKLATPRVYARHAVARAED